MGELAYIRVPLINHSDYAKINQLQIVQSTKWQQRIVAQIHQAYHKAPYYQQLEELISKFFIEEPESYNLSDYNIAIIEYIRKLLNIDISTNLVSRLNIQSKKTDAVLDIIKSANGTEYISGNGAKKYHDAEKFEIYNIQLNYPDFPSYFDKLMIPNHFKYASILSYLAHYSIDEIRGFLAWDKCLSE